MRLIALEGIDGPGPEPETGITEGVLMSKYKENQLLDVEEDGEIAPIYFFVPEALSGEVAELERKIAAAQSKLRGVAQANWGFSAAGGGPQTDPEVMRLRAALRRDRQSLRASRDRLRDLTVEASLAGVPDEWTEPPAPPASEATPRSSPGR